MHRSGWVPSIVPDGDDQTIHLVDDAPQPGHATQLQQATVEARIRDPQRYPVLPEIITPLSKISRPRNSFDCVWTCAVRSVRWALGLPPCWKHSPRC
jgi:hypothetical protein